MMLLVRVFEDHDIDVQPPLIRAWVWCWVDHMSMIRTPVSMLTTFGPCYEDRDLKPNLPLRDRATLAILI